MSKRKRINKNNSAEKSSLIHKDDKKDYNILFEAILISLLLVFGTYNSIIYWGHQPVPHFDYHCFVDTARDILGFNLPSSLKRVPLTGMLFIFFGKITGGQCPPFHGAWLLNSVLYPLNGILFYLVGKRFIGKAAFFFALIAMLNPWVVQLLTEAIVETTLLFCFLLSFWLMLKRSKWVYLTACAATMVRYEGALLIMAAFILDMIYYKDNKERLKSFGLSAAASVPLGLWMLATLLRWRQQGQTHYLKEFGSQSGGEIVYFEYIKLMWEVGFKPLLIAPSPIDKAGLSILLWFSKIFAAVGFISGLVYALIKRNWHLLVLVLVLALYLLIHAVHSWTFKRFCMPVFWMAMLVFFYGVIHLWRFIERKLRIPGWLIVIIQLLFAVGVFCWALVLFLNLIQPRWETVSRASFYVFPAAIAVLVISFFVHLIFRKKITLPANLLIHLLFMLFIISNQFTLASLVQDGERDIEFKHLLDWYLENAEKDEKLTMSVPYILETMAPAHKDNFVRVSHIDANNPNEFVIECYKRDITYIAWDSRMGLNPKSRYYKSWKMKNIAPLIKPQDNGPYDFITTLKGAGRYRYINLFRLKPLPDNIDPSILEKRLQKRKN